MKIPLLILSLENTKSKNIFFPTLLKCGTYLVKLEIVPYSQKNYQGHFQYLSFLCFSRVKDTSLQLVESFV